MKIEMDFERVHSLLETLGGAKGVFEELAENETQGFAKALYQHNAEMCQEHIDYFTKNWNEQHPIRKG